jgi:hypothetical protein
MRKSLTPLGFSSIIKPYKPHLIYILSSSSREVHPVKLRNIFHRIKGKADGYRVVTVGRDVSGMITVSFKFILM